jgi:hypothetical protein
LSRDDPYNPLDKLNLGESVADALLRVAVRPLSDTANLVGAGVYAIYYTGSFKPYRPIGTPDADGRFERPIYVGKAVPKGARKGGLTFDSGRGTALRDRLRQHAASIEQTKNLGLRDFRYRAMMVDDIWIPLGENVLIEKFQPLWNRVIDGFGNRDPGRRRATQFRSSWDVLHPGRDFARKLAPNPLTAARIVKKIEDFFAGRLAEKDKIRDDGSASDEADEVQ